MKTIYQRQTEGLNSRTAENKEKKKKAETGGFELMLCLSRVERSTAEPAGNKVITCRLRGGNFEKSSLAEFGLVALFFRRGWRRLLCGWDLARSRGLGGSGCAPVSQLFFGCVRPVTMETR